MIAVEKYKKKWSKIVKATVAAAEEAVWEKKEKACKQIRKKFVELSQQQEKLWNDIDCTNLNEQKDKLWKFIPTMVSTSQRKLPHITCEL